MLPTLVNSQKEHSNKAAIFFQNKARNYKIKIITKGQIFLAHADIFVTRIPSLLKPKGVLSPVFEV